MLAVGQMSGIHTSLRVAPGPFDRHPIVGGNANASRQIVTRARTGRRYLRTLERSRGMAVSSMWKYEYAGRRGLRANSVELRNPMAYYAMSPNNISHGSPPPSAPPSGGNSNNNHNGNGDKDIGQIAMRNEKIFNRGGFYSFIVKNNILAHREAIIYGKKIVQQWIAGRQNKRPIKVLDLACGGIPITIAEVMASFTEERFEFTGIDINADQVVFAKDHFQYPPNIDSVNILVGNAWNLEGLPLDDHYDIIFTGLNLHHGTPEEIYYVTLQIGALLGEDGVFFNHDIYRPNHIKYLRRPEHHDSVPDVYHLIEEGALSSIDIPEFNIDEYHAGIRSEADWRVEFLRRYEALMIELGAEEAGIADILDHMYERDFPISTNEAAQIFASAGLKLSVDSLGDTDLPLGDYLALVTARNHRGIRQI